jgi:hypothetical protein
MSAPEMNEKLFSIVASEIRSAVKADACEVHIASLTMDVLRAIDLAGYEIVLRHPAPKGTQ